MQQIMLVLAILLLMIFVPKRYSEKTEANVTLMMKMPTMQEKESVKSDEDDYPDNDFCIYCSVIDISSL